MPAAPTTMRRRLLGERRWRPRRRRRAPASAPAASRPSRALRRRQAFTAQAWPNSCSALSSGKTSASSSRLSAREHAVAEVLRELAPVLRPQQQRRQPTTASHSSGAEHSEQRPRAMAASARAADRGRTAACLIASGSGQRAIRVRRRAPRALETARRRRATRRTAAGRRRAAGRAGWITSSCVGASSPKRSRRGVPDRLHGALAVHQADDEVGRRRRSGGCGATIAVLQHVPAAPAVARGGGCASASAGAAAAARRGTRMG